MISTSPAAGTPLVKGSTRGRRLLDAARRKVRGSERRRRDARARPAPVLQARGFKVGPSSSARPAPARPAPCSRSRPRSGKAPQGSTVTLTVAKALPNVRVPYLIGLARGRRPTRRSPSSASCRSRSSSSSTSTRGYDGLVIAAVAGRRRLGAAADAASRSTSSSTDGADAGRRGTDGADRPDGRRAGRRADERRRPSGSSDAAVSGPIGRRATDQRHDGDRAAASGAT